MDPAADNGLQAERTELAWRRTQVSLCLVACLALRGHSYWLVAVALGSAALVGLGQRKRYRQSLAMLQGQGGQARVALVVSTCAMLALMVALAAPLP